MFPLIKVVPDFFRNIGIPENDERVVRNTLSVELTSPISEPPNRTVGTVLCENIELLVDNDVEPGQDLAMISKNEYIIGAS